MRQLGVAVGRDGQVFPAVAIEDRGDGVVARAFGGVQQRHGLRARHRCREVGVGVLHDHRVGRVQIAEHARARGGEGGRHRVLRWAGEGVGAAGTHRVQAVGEVELHPIRVGPPGRWRGVQRGRAHAKVKLVLSQLRPLRGRHRAGVARRGIGRRAVGFFVGQIARLQKDALVLAVAGTVRERARRHLQRGGVRALEHHPVVGHADLVEDRGGGQVGRLRAIGRDHQQLHAERLRRLQRHRRRGQPGAQTTTDLAAAAAARGHEGRRHQHRRTGRPSGPQAPSPASDGNRSGRVPQQRTCFHDALLMLRIVGLKRVALGIPKAIPS